MRALKLFTIAVADSLVAKFQRMDTEGSFECFANSPDWGMVNADGSKLNFQEAKKQWLNSPSILTDWKWTTIRRDFKILTKNIVICDWDAKIEVAMKTGDKITYDPDAYTMIFKKIKGQWRIIHTNESGIPVMQKPENVAK
ncbi:MAG: hypothetical protein WC699_00685 [Bacteroidales bacterium]|jgi:hypothetical protein